MMIGKAKTQRNIFGTFKIETKITERDKKLLVVLGVVLVLFLSYYFIYRPLSSKIELLQAEKAVMDKTVATAKDDLQSEEIIKKTLAAELEKGKISASVFFPKVYPYKDRFVLLLENIMNASKVSLNSVKFSDPRVSSVKTPIVKGLNLPNYPLLDAAYKINRIYSKKNDDNKLNSQNKNVTQPKADVTSDAVMILPCELVFEGDYIQVRQIIGAFESLKRTISLEEVSISEQDGILQVNLKLSFYAVEKIDNGEDQFNIWAIKGSYGKANPFK